MAPSDEGTPSAIGSQPGPPTGPAIEAPAPPTVDDRWRHRHPASPVLNSFDIAIRLLPIIIITLLSDGSSGALLLGGMAIVFAYSLVAHARYTYLLEPDRLSVRSGVFVQQQRTLPADRVQQVSLNRKVRHFALGVADVTVEAAGTGAERELRLSALGLDEAERIRAVLSESRRQLADDAGPADTGPAPRPPSSSVEIYRPPNHALVRWALANSPLLAIPVVAALVALMLELGVDGPLAEVWSGPSAALLTIAGFAAIGLIGGTAATVLRFFDLRLEQADEDLRLRYGVLTQREADVPRRRVQVLGEERSLAGRLAGVVSLTAHTASGSRTGAAATLPAVPTIDRALVARELLPGLDLAAELVRHPAAARRRAVIRRVVPAIVVVALTTLLVDSPWRYAALALIPIALAAGLRAYAVLAHGETDDVVTGRKGVLTEHTMHVRRDRVQSTLTRSSWFQRHRGLATLEIHVAQPLGQVIVGDLAAHDATRIAADLVATSASVSGRLS